jgi:pimeloyl-ACP methyl ester carboxylesterase
MFRNSKNEVRQEKGFNFIKSAPDNPGADPLICLHGMFGGLSNFDPLIERVNHNVIYVPEIPLYNLSKGRLSITGLAEWLREFITELEIQNPILLGNSMGGHIALEYALLYPEDVKALILTGSSGLKENGFGSSYPRRNDPEYIREQANLTFYEDLVDEVMLEEILEVVQSPSKLTRLLWIARNTQKHNMSAALPEILHPTLLVWGKNDIITPPEVGEMFCKKMPNATLKWIDKCGHAPMLERPAEFVKHVKPFLAELSETENINLK